MNVELQNGKGRFFNCNEGRIGFDTFLLTAPARISEYYGFPTCPDLERDFKKVFRGEVDLSGMIFDGGVLIAKIGLSDVSKLGQWGKGEDGQHIAIIKNIDEDPVVAKFVGNRNAIALVNGFLFAGYPTRDSIEIVRPVRTPYQTEFRGLIKKFLQYDKYGPLA